MRYYLSLFIVLLSGCARKPYEQLAEESIALRKQKTTVAPETLKRASSLHIKDMNLEQALEARAYYAHYGYDDMLIKVLPQVIALSRDAAQIADATLELADLYLKQGNFEQAEKMYGNYVALYPGSDQAKVAHYYRIMTSYWDSLPADRDQAATRSTIELARTYIRDFPEDTIFKDKVFDLLVACYKKLLESELSILSFYLKKYHHLVLDSSLQAAWERLVYIKNEILSPLGIDEPRYQKIERELDVAFEKIANEEPAEAIKSKVAVITEKSTQLRALLDNASPAIALRDAF